MSNTSKGTGAEENGARSISPEESGSRVPAPGPAEDGTQAPKDSGEYGDVIEGLDPDLAGDTEGQPT